MGALFLMIALAQTDGGLRDRDGRLLTSGLKDGLSILIRIDAALVAGACERATQELDSDRSNGLSNDMRELFRGRIELCQGKPAEASRRFEALTYNSPSVSSYWAWRAVAARALNLPALENEYRNECFRLDSTGASCDPTRR